MITYQNIYDSILSEISALCIKNDVENLCVLGDMNTDLSRSYSWHTHLLRMKTYL